MRVHPRSCAIRRTPDLLSSWPDLIRLSWQHLECLEEEVAARRNCPTSAPAAAADAAFGIGPGHAWIDLARRCAGCARRGATPPRPRSRRPPRPAAARRARPAPRRCCASVCSTSAPAASRPSSLLQRRDLVRRRRGGDHHRRGRRACPRSSPAPLRSAPRHRASPVRSSCSVGAWSRAQPSCPSVAREQEPASTAAWPSTSAAARPASLRSGSRPGATEIRRQAHGDAGAAGDQRMVGRRPRRSPPDARRSPHRRWRSGGPFLQRGHGVADRRGALLDRGDTAPARPCRRSAATARAPGWRRSSASADGSPSRSRSAARRRRTDGPDRRCGRWPGTRGRPARSRSPALRPAHRPPGRYCRLGAVEGRAVLEEELPRSRRQRSQRGGEAFGDCLPHRGGARFQCDDDGIGVGHRVAGCGTPISCTVRMPPRDQHGPDRWRR